MSKKNFKDVEVRLRIPSSLPDLTCTDGEVAEFSNVPWLQALADEAAEKGKKDGNNPDNDSEESTELRLTQTPAGITFSPGASLLAIHSPAALHGKRRYLILNSAGTPAIYYNSDNPDSSTIVIETMSGFNASATGKIKKALPVDDFILLIGENGTQWLVFDADTLSYHVPSSPPQAPNVSFSLEPVALSGYNLTTDALPELETAVDLPETLGCNLEGLEDWLDRGSASSVNEEVRARVFQAVGAAVVAYEKDVASRGLFLLAPRCVASFDGVLPSEVVKPYIEDEYDYSSPFGLLKAWSYYGETLRLRFYFSLRPLRLLASFSVGQSQTVWAKRFPTVDFSITEHVDWHDDASGFSATAFNSYHNPSSGAREGFAFRFATALSSSEINSRIRHKNLRRVERHGFKVNHSLNIYLPCIKSIGHGDCPVFIPDYRDFSLPTPEYGAVTDRGIILFGGSCDIRNELDEHSTISLSKSIISSHKDYPFVFRHHCKAVEGNIISISQAGSSKGAGEYGRLPLYMLSSDGIRLLTSDGEGGYSVSRLISRLAPDVSFPIAQGYEHLFFRSSAGPATLSLSATVKLPQVSLPAGEWTHAGLMGKDEFLLLSSEEGCALHDIENDKTYHPQGIVFNSIATYEGVTYALLNSGGILNPGSPFGTSILYRIDIVRHTLTASSETLPPELNPISRITTRPLKFGTPTERKRIIGIGVAHPEISVILEGSDDMQYWRELCTRTPTPSTESNPSPLSFLNFGPLRLPAFRYYRLYADAPEENAESLASFFFRLR